MRRPLHTFRSEVGMTLVELLMAMIIGVAVILAAFAVLDTAVSQQAKVADRSDAAQRGRQAMEEITQQMRSTVCLSSSTPPRAIVSGTDSQVTFYADLGDGSTPPQKRTLTFDPVAKTITEQDYNGDTNTPPGFGATPSRTRQLLTNVAQLNGAPVFAYHAYASPGVLDTNALTTPLSTTDAARVVDVTISFLAGPTDGVVSRGTGFTSDVFTRFANPANPNAPMPCT